MSDTGLVVGSAAMQGFRSSMEDAHVVMDLPGLPTPHLFLAVFDGHSGDGAAKYAEKNIVRVLRETKSWSEYCANGCEDVYLLSAALKEAFISVDEEMRVEVEVGKSGTTSVVAVVTPAHIVCANAGDSRCVLGTGGRTATKPLSHDHKPSLPEELARIDKAGGWVQYRVGGARVDGDLAVSRGLGDFKFKDNPALLPAEQKVTCVPDVVVHAREPDDDVLLLACDGVWDVFDSDAAVNAVRELYLLGEEDMQKIAEEVADVALEKKSEDNISVVVAKLPGAVIGPASSGGVDARREARQQQSTTVM